MLDIKDMIKAAEEYSKKLLDSCKAMKDAISNALKNNDGDKEGTLPGTVVTAVHNNDMGGVKQFIASGGNVNDTTTTGGFTLLIFAASYNPNADITRVLLNAGADPWQRDQNGFLPIYFADMNNHWETGDVLRDAMGVDKKVNESAQA